MSVGDDVHGSGRCHNGKHEKKGTYDRSKSGHDQKEEGHASKVLASNQVKTWCTFSCGNSVHYNNQTNKYMNTNTNSHLRKPC